VAHHTFDHRADQLLDSLSRWVEAD
jgi:hypothetical protein